MPEDIKPTYYINLIRRMLVAHEGVRQKPYKDSLGIWTIGVGHNLKANPIKLRGKIFNDSPDSIAELKAYPLTIGECYEILSKDIQIAENDARALVPSLDKLQPEYKAVLVDMAFNMGRTKLSGFKRFLAAINKGDFRTASKEMLDSKWAAQVGKRATNLSAMLERPFA